MKSLSSAIKMVKAKEMGAARKAVKLAAKPMTKKMIVATIKKAKKK